MKKLLLFTLITCLAIGQTIAQVPTNCLVGYYPFTGNASDSSGNGNNGTVNGTTLTTDRFGNANSAYAFNGSNSYISLPSGSSTSLNIIGDLTESFWLKTTDSSGLIIGCGTPITPPYPGYGAGLNSGSVGNGKIGYNINGNNYGSTINTLSDNNWHNITIVLKSDTLRLYIDNVLNNQVTGVPQPLSHNGTRVLGCRPDLFMTSESNYGGILDDIRIYNCALTQQEVSNLYFTCTGNPVNSIVSYGPTTFCAGSNVLLSAPATFASYQWKKNGVAISGANSNTYTATQSGTYKCVLTCGASSSTSNGILLTRLDNASNSITSTGSLAFCAGDSLSLSSTNSTAGYTYQWYRSNVSIAGAVGKNYNAKNPGTYKVVSKHPSNGCSRISSNSITSTVNCRMGNPGLISGPVEKQENNKINLFPNPNNGSFTIEYLNEDLEDGNASIEILNTIGKVVYSSQAQFMDGHLSQEINLQNNFSTGIYMVNIIVNGERISSKALLQ